MEKSKCKVAVLFLMTLFLAVSCATTSNTSVARVDADTVVDLTGYWNDVDVSIVCDSLISECLNSPRLNNYYEKNGRYPVITLGRFANKSDEHIDTEIIQTKMRTAIINSGVADFLASGEFREDLRRERDDQEHNANEDQKKALQNEDAADYLLQGSVRTIIQKNDNKSVRVYYVNAELVDVETNRIIWQGENDSIKKLVQNSKVKW